MMAVALATLCWAPPARADVIEITEAGEARVIAADARPAAPIAAPARARAARLEALRPHLEQAGAIANLSPALLEAVAYAESRFNTRARSPAGAIGAMQLMPGTAAALGVDPHHPAQNAAGGARYLRAMLEQFGGDLELALAAYNAGPEAVRRHRGVPPYRETRQFVAAVMGYMAQSASGGAQP